MFVVVLGGADDDDDDDDLSHFSLLTFDLVRI